MRRITIDCSDVAFAWVVSMFAAIQTNLPGEELKATIDPVAEPTARARVQYRAIGDASVMGHLGAHTVEGIIFHHLLTNGPATAKAIQEAKMFRVKSVESSLTRLRAMNVVVSEPIATV